MQNFEVILSNEMILYTDYFISLYLSFGCVPNVHYGTVLSIREVSVSESGCLLAVPIQWLIHVSCELPIDFFMFNNYY